MKFLSRSQWIIDPFVEFLSSLPENVEKGRKGCTIFCLNLETGIPEIKQYGNDAPERRLLTARYAPEKVLRIIEKDEQRSIFSAKEEKKKFGGGVKSSSFAIAPSGWPWKQDEVLGVFLIGIHAVQRDIADFSSLSSASFLNALFPYVKDFYETCILGSAYPNEEFEKILPRFFDMSNSLLFPEPK